MGICISILGPSHTTKVSKLSVFCLFLIAYVLPEENSVSVVKRKAIESPSDLRSTKEWSAKLRLAGSSFRKSDGRRYKMCTRNQIMFVCLLYSSIYIVIPGSGKEMHKLEEQFLDVHDCAEHQSKKQRIGGT